MSELSTLANLAEIVGVLIVIGGLFFALLQMRQIRQQRRELAAIELFRFFGSPNFAAAYKTVLHMPDGMSAAAIRDGEEGLEDAAMLISTTMENIGVMTYQRIVPFQIVNNLIGVSTQVLWRKLALWADGVRDELQDPAAFEWFQWLADRLEENQEPRTAPAYEAESGWQPTNSRQSF